MSVLSVNKALFMSQSYREIHVAVDNMAFSTVWKSDSKTRPWKTQQGNRHKGRVFRPVVQAHLEHVRLQIPAYLLPLIRSTERRGCG